MRTFNCGICDNVVYDDEFGVVLGILTCGGCEEKYYAEYARTKQEFNDNYLRYARQRINLEHDTQREESMYHDDGQRIDGSDGDMCARIREEKEESDAEYYARHGYNEYGFKVG